MKKNHMVKCTATQCKYNDSNYCTSHKINVKGNDATESTETLCDTFTSKSNVLTNALSSIDCSGETKINCIAKNCVYNENEECTLNNINVNCTCDSCNCNTAHETCCSSFKMK